MGVRSGISRIGLARLRALNRRGVLLPLVAVIFILSVVALITTNPSRTGRVETSQTEDANLDQSETLSSGEGESLPGEVPSGTAKGKGSKNVASGFAGPGILPADKTPIKIGAITPKGDAAAAFGASLPLPDIPHLIRSMEKEINETGGVAGRPIQVIIKEVDTTDQDAATQSRLQNEACKSLTEDHRVFLVSGASEYTFKCYADHKTPMLPGGRVLTLADEQDFQQYRPWLLPPTLPLLDTIARFAPEAWHQEGALTKRMGLIGYEIPALRRSASLLKNEIERKGGKVIDEGWSAVTYRDSNLMIAQKVIDFKRLEIDRVLFWAPGGGAWLSFSRTSDSQFYYPRYLLTSHDYPQSMIEVFGPGLPESQRKNSINASSKYLDDVSEKAFPLTEREKSCLATVNKRANTNYQTRTLTEGGAALTICEVFYLTRAALAPGTGKPLNPLEIPGMMVLLGNNYKPVLWAEYRFAAGRIDATSTYGRGYYDEGCTCYAYRNPAFYPVP